VENNPKGQDSPASTVPASQDGKQMVSPVLVFVWSMPEATVPCLAVREWQEARLPGWSRLDVTGIRLI